MDTSSKHVQQARETLEAARISLEAARRTHDQAGDEASAEVLREAQVAYDDARAAYHNAVGAAQADDRPAVGESRTEPQI